MKKNLRLKTIPIISLLIYSCMTYSENKIEIPNEYSSKHDVYKILTLQEWDTAKKNGRVITDLDQRDGFIHLSSSSQLSLTLSLYFKDYKEVVLLQVDTDKVKDKLIFEEPVPKGSRAGLFPHIYGELLTEQITKAWVLERGAFLLPEEILIQSET